MKILTDSNRDANDVKSIADKIQLNNVLAPQSSHKTNENNQQYTKDKMKENTLYTNNVNAPYSMMKETNGNNETYVNDKISDKVRVLNVQASHSMPTTEVITPDLSLFSKRDLQKVISKQVFRKDDIGSAMEFNTQLNTKQVQNEKNSRPTMTEYSTPIMNTDVPVVHRVEKEDMMGRNMGGIPNMAARQSEQTMKENNKSNISFRMQMYNRDF